ncbi:sporulation protein [Thalassotalea sp. G20_0]|uniref:sporulation protein n=1 Tax=Thalassotalea sp. G20_0 TaxID=2821093 RepID=UPI002570DCDC|nr:MULTISPECIES: sporulation protein [Gammaproteobacteria]
MEKRKGGDEGTVTEKVKQTCSLSQWSLPETFIIAPGEERIFNASFILPHNTPLTPESLTKSWLIENTPNVDTRDFGRLRATAAGSDSHDNGNKKITLELLSRDHVKSPCLNM